VKQPVKKDYEEGKELEAKDSLFSFVALKVKTFRGEQGEKKSRTYKLLLKSKDDASDDP
jgi:hypothetical protein